MAESFAGKEVLQAGRASASFGEMGRRSSSLAVRLRGGVFQNITLHHNRYSTRISLADFLAIRADAPLGRFMRQKLDRNLYKQFKDALSAEFYRRYHDPIAHVRDVHIAVGTKS